MFTLTEDNGNWKEKEICFGDEKYCTDKLSGEFERYILSFGEDEQGWFAIVSYKLLVFNICTKTNFLKDVTNGGRILCSSVSFKEECNARMVPSTSRD